jgi:capsular exopolysaccharide synthesis family protein
MEYVQIKGTLELGYLSSLLSREQQLTTEQWMLDLQFPKLKGGSPELIRDAFNLTRQTGAISPPSPTAPVVASGTPPAGTPPAAGPPAGTPVVPAVQPGAEASGFDDGRGYQEDRVRLAHLERQKKELEGNIQADHPQIRSLENDIAAIRRKLELNAEVEYARVQERGEAIKMHLDALEEAQRRWKNSYLMASRKAADFSHLQQAVSRLDAMYGMLYGRLNDLRIDQEIKGEHFFVLEPVKTDKKPVWPDPFKILITALVAGIGSGLAMALLAYFFDDKVQSVADVETEIGVPFLGGIPYWVHSDLVTRIRPIVTDQHKSGAAEAYRALRTNVLSAMDKAGKNVLLVTSADSKEGKTLTVLNLALMIANAGKRVALLDTDLRRGVLHKSLETERTPGLVDALKQRRPLAEVVKPTAFPNLFFAPAGSVEKNTSELLHGADLTRALTELAEQYDYVLMDSAPVLRVTDTVIMAGCPVCAVVYVAHANHTAKPVIKYSLDMLGDSHVVGLIVNSIEMHRISSLYYTYQYPNYAYYSYAYAYGYDYDLYDEHGRRTGRPRHRGRVGTALRSARQWLRRTFLPTE